MTNKKVLPVLMMLFTVFLLGMSFLSIEIAMEVVPPMMLGFLRFLVASIFLIIIVRVKKAKTSINKKDIPLFVIAGFIGITMYFFFTNKGIKILNASSASIIIASIPIFTIIFDSIIYKAKVTKTKIIGVLLSFVGVYFVVGADIQNLIHTDVGTGYLMMFGAVISWVIYSLVTKPLFGKYSELVIAYYQNIFGTILFIPFIIFETTKWAEVSVPIVFHILYLGIFCSAIGYITYLYGMKHLGISISSIYLNVIPLVTVTASILILDEKITLFKAIGGLLIIIAVTVTNWKREPQNKNISTKNKGIYNLAKRRG